MLLLATARSAQAEQCTCAVGVRAAETSPPQLAGRVYVPAHAAQSEAAARPLDAVMLRQVETAHRPAYARAHALSHTHTCMYVVKLRSVALISYA